MGIIKPPWIEEDWFNKCPFNYCDHFGDKKLLSRVCKICKEELDMLKKYKKEGKDPNDMKIVLNEIGGQFIKTSNLLYKAAEEQGINLDDLDNIEEDKPDFTKDPLYELARDYGDCVEDIIKSTNLFQTIDSTNQKFYEQAVDSLAHSRHFIQAKIYRALSSEYRELKRPEDDLFDSKTSAFFAYVAVLRNCQYLLPLAKSNIHLGQEQINLRFSKVSFKLAKIIRSRFFPNYELIYHEFGITIPSN